MAHPIQTIAATGGRSRRILARLAVPHAPIAAFVACLFLADLQLELGVSIYALYVPVLAGFALSSGRRFVPLLTLATTVLTIAGYFGSPEGGELWKAMANRASVILAIWATAVLLLRQRRLEKDWDLARTDADQTKQESARRAQEARASARMLAAAEEAERGRMAREVHDALGQPLTAMKFDLEWLAGRLSTADASVRNRVAEMGELASSTIDTVRHLATELRPSSLDDIGLFAAMRSHVLDFTERSDIDCRLAIPVVEPEWSDERSATVFRVLQEALNNVLRHAHATNAWVSLSEDDDGIVLQVRDDGCGITALQAAAGETLGIVGMRERARLHGGSVRVAGGDEGGTTVTLRLPAAPVASR